MALYGGDGENVTLGRKADEPVTDPDKSASVVALLKGSLRSAATVQDPWQETLLREVQMIRLGIGILVGADLEALLED